jgi:hypothetical protein
MVAVEYHADLEEVQRDPRLAALLSSPAQAAPFDRLEWWRGLAAHCGIEPRLAVARQGESIAVLPLHARGGELCALANWYTFRFRPLLSPGADASALLDGLARDLAARADRVTLAGLPDEDGGATLVEQAFRRAGWLVRREVCDTNHFLEVKGRSFEDYLKGRPGPLRTTLKRKTAKLEIEVLTHFDGAAWAGYEAVYGQSWKPAEGSPGFLRAFARAEGAAGRLRLGIARHGGRAVAAQLWTVEGGTAFIHKLAYLDEAKALSPGSVLTAALLRGAIDRDRVAVVDFGTGDDAYKRDWMEQARPRYRLDMFRPFAPRNWLIFAKGGLRRLAGKRNHG